MPNSRSRHAGEDRGTRPARTLLALGAVATLVCTGCHTLHFEIVDAPHARVVHHQKSYFFAGLLPRQQRVDVSRFCPHGVARVREQTTPGDAALGLATLGIWTPRSSWYSCLPGPGEGPGWMIDVPTPPQAEPAGERSEAAPPPASPGHRSSS